MSTDVTQQAVQARSLVAAVAIGVSLICILAVDFALRPRDGWCSRSGVTSPIPLGASKAGASSEGCRMSGVVQYYIDMDFTTEKGSGGAKAKKSEKGMPTTGIEPVIFAYRRSDTSATH